MMSSRALKDNTRSSTGVAGDDDGIGYFGYALTLKTTPISSAQYRSKKAPESKPVTVSAETILDKSYSPLSRPLYIFVKNSSLRRPEVLTFVKYTISDNIENLAKKEGTSLPRRPIARRTRKRCQPVPVAPSSRPSPRSSLPLSRRPVRALAFPANTKGRPVSTTAVTRRESNADLWTKPTRLRLRTGSCRVWGSCFFCGDYGGLTTIGIVLVLGLESWKFFQVSECALLDDFLGGAELKPDREPPKFGILPLIWGTFMVAAGSGAIALPIGLLSAIYLSEYAPRRVRALLKPALELLAGIPTIVYGYLALLLVTPVAESACSGPLCGFRVEMFNALSPRVLPRSSA